MDRSDRAGDAFPPLTISADKSDGEPLPPWFTVEELDGLYRAYAQGQGRGDVLVGLQGGHRLLTLNLAPRQTEAEALLQVERTAARLVGMGCDGWLWCRPVLVESGAGKQKALLVEEAYNSGMERRHRVTALVDDTANPNFRRVQIAADAISTAFARIVQPS